MPWILLETREANVRCDIFSYLSISIRRSSRNRRDLDEKCRPLATIACALRCARPIYAVDNDALNRLYND